MRLIDADALLKGKQDHEMISTHIIWNAPTIDVEPIRHGKWIKNDEYSDEIEGHMVYECSECGELYDWFDVPEHKYCRQCGAKMDEVTE